MSRSMRRLPLLQWMKQNQHRPGMRGGLDLAQASYGLMRRLRGDLERAAIDGGRPVRLLPLPAPRPFSRAEARAVRRVMAAQNTSYFDGGVLPEFEQRFAARWGAAHAIAVSSGTAALHTALIAANIAPGDEVLVPAVTYISTAFAVLYQGARVRFVDVEPGSLGIDPTRLEAAITDRTRAILPVHLCGVPCDLDGVLRVAKAHGLKVIEDAAQAHGARYRGREVGTLGDLGCFSFGSIKTMVTGEGGMVLTDDPELARRARLAMSLAETSALSQEPTPERSSWSPETRVDYGLVGWNYRMSAVQAALGLVQLERLPRMMEQRRNNADMLLEAVHDLAALEPQAVPEGAEPCYSTVLMHCKEPSLRTQLIEGLKHERIDYRMPLQPLPEHGIFGDRGSYPGARSVYECSLGLRVDPALRAGDMRSCVEALRRNVLRA